MIEHYLQRIIDSESFESLPASWQDLYSADFSNTKRLHSFQNKALENAIKTLYLFYREKDDEITDSKQKLFQMYEINGSPSSLQYKAEGKTENYFSEYNYPIKNKKISLSEFINRAGFWMATGSGKTLIIIKIIEILSKLMREQQVPENDILFLAPRDDLLQQFRKHVDEFNTMHFDLKINLRSLKDYGQVKNQNPMLFQNREITIFYYRSDLISDERKQLKVDFRDYESGGKWYILLDEAHKGDKDDSKRQAFYSILSRNGFLFNFSATFTDDIDLATCAFNFNLEKFTQEGYGKHIYVSDQAVTAFQVSDEFSQQDKQRIILKTLILQTYIYKNFEKIRQYDNSLYHRPLLMTLVNTVNREEADLKLFFAELVKIAQNGIAKNLFEDAKKDLIKEFIGNEKKYSYENMVVKIYEDMLLSITYDDVLKIIFNADNPGSIEYLRIPGNQKEVAFKLKTAEHPFALMKIGDISNWTKALSPDYEIIEKFEAKSVFQSINDSDSPIKILMGSRAFYEGWDSNRPNIVLFINIGMTDAKKFVLQSIGRGVRIEPLKDKRRRILQLSNSDQANRDLVHAIKDFVLPVESLFVYGTNATFLREIIKQIREHKEVKNLGDEFIVNDKAEQISLLIPTYKKMDASPDHDEFKKYSITSKDYELIAKLFHALGDKVALMKYHPSLDIISRFSDSLQSPDKYYNFYDSKDIAKPEFILGRILNYLNIRMERIDTFKGLKDEIVHFRHIQFRSSDMEKFEEIKKKIAIMREYPQKKSDLDKAYGSVSVSEYNQKREDLEQASLFSFEGKSVKIKHIAEHYYLPILVSDSERIDYLNHVIDVSSEKKFIDDLEIHIKQDEHIFRQFDWWMFSKIDHSLDGIYTPYYNQKSNKISRFYPDFIFWMQKGKDYEIWFIDPKGTEHTAGEKKLDGFWDTFNKKSEYSYQGLNIKVRLFFRTDEISKTTRNYRDYWFDNFEALAQKLQ